MPIDAEEFRSTVEQEASDDENVDEILAGVQELAEERARRLHREPTRDDVEYFLSMFCWNPLKPDPPEQVRIELKRIRQRAIRSRQWVDLRSYVSDEAFTWTREQLYNAQQRDVNLFLTEELPAGGDE
jgi:hypothetical protein